MKPGQFLEFESLEKAYLGKRVHDLLATIFDQVSIIYKRRGITFPVTASSTLQYIAQYDGVSLADIAKALQVTHQITTQRVQKLQKLGLVEKHSDVNDRRRFEWRLTSQGQEQAARLEACMQAVVQVYETLNNELELDLGAVLEKARNALLETPLQDRFAAIENIKKAG